MVYNFHAKCFFTPARIQQAGIMSVHIFMYCARYFCPILTKIKFLKQSLIKRPSTKFYKNPFSGSWIVLCGWTDEHDEANSHNLQLCKCA
jgi:hypothetical protein